jgi:hypothetical protein
MPNDADIARAALITMDVILVLPLIGCLNQPPLQRKFKRIGVVGWRIRDRMLPFLK